MSKQLLQNIRTGELDVTEVPAPSILPGHVLIANTASIISAGTEKSIMTLAGKSLIGKAKERPDHVKRVLEKVRNEGLVNTFKQVREKLDEPMTMGYSSAGVVIGCGDGVQGFKPGDRVASNGPHAEVVSVPKHLCARVPDDTPLESAAFAVIGSIALHGIRLSRCTLGETVFVIGLGLVGQMAVAILKAMGCKVIGTDPDASKCELAIQMGADRAAPGISASDVEGMTEGLGSDVVLITASTTSNGPIELASNAVRQKGRIVLVGVVGLELDRRPLYFKEAEFLVSCSYGPGRYDPSYEDFGHDYPAPYVRWTEQRNIQTVVDLIAEGKVDVQALLTHRYDISAAETAYEMIKSGQEKYLAISLLYPNSEEAARSTATLSIASPTTSSQPGIGVLGAGNFARMTLLPAIFSNKEVVPSAICSARGVSASQLGEKYGFATATTDEEAVLAGSDVDAVFVLTRHDLHGRQVLESIRNGKHVFVEKPLCLTEDELQQIEQARTSASEGPIAMVGFNRRFSPAATMVREHFSSVSSPITLSIRFNAGFIPADHWTQIEAVGGGRIVGEACHAIDLATYLTGSEVIRVFAESVGNVPEGQISDDQCQIVLRHKNGSASHIMYTSSGDKGFPKERVEMFGGGRVGVIDDYKSVLLSGGGKDKSHTFKQQDKGHKAEVAAFLDAITNTGMAPIPWHEIVATTRASLLAVKSIREGRAFPV